MVVKRTVPMPDIRRRRRTSAMCFGLPAMLVLLFYLVGGITPFGDTTFLSMDLYSQYFPMITSLREGLRQGDLLYSFSAGLGFNRLAQGAYYTGSIFWYVLALLPEALMIPVFHLMLAFKLGLGGWTFSLYLRRRYGEELPLCVGFSMAYALCGYLLAYIQQIMWTDAVILLPVVMLGLWQLLEEKRPLTYYLALSALLLSSFYVGFCVCIFTALQFLVWELSEARPLAARARRTGRFALYSLLSGGTAAVFLVPTYLAISGTKASELGFEGGLRLYHSAREVIESLMPFTKPEIGYGVPNIYCGVFILLGVILYATCRHVSLRRRLLNLSLLAFLLLSFELNLLDYIWHGFHYPNQLPGRQSFVFVFLALTLSYEAITAIRVQKRYTVMLATALPAILLLALRPSGIGERVALILGAVLLIGYGILLLAPFRGRRTAATAFALLIILEVGANAALTLGAYTRTYSKTAYTTHAEEMAALTEQYESGREDLWRTESFPYLSFNSGQLYGHKGVSYYSSMMSGGQYDFLQAAGFGVYGANVSAIYTPTPVINALLNVRYVYERDGRAPLSSLIPCRTEGRITVKENRYYLPFAFVVDEEMATLAPDGEENTFDFQNRWLIATGATSRKAFTSLRGKSTVINADLHLSADGNRYYQRKDPTQPVVCEFTYTVYAPGEHYLTSDFRWGTMEVWINGELSQTVDTFLQRTACIGTLAANDQVTLRLTGSHDYALYGAELYRFREEVMADAHEALLPGGAIVTRFRSTRIDATVTAEEDGLLYITLPYDGGWRMTVDGHAVELSPLAGFLTCAPIEAGEHTVTLRYTPPGFGLGLLVTFASVSIALAPFAIDCIRKKKTAQCAAKDVK